ncbi:hypothetical protein A247_01468, partial [Pseudomonas syringae pv. actinidiae ICMP 19099]
AANAVDKASQALASTKGNVNSAPANVRSANDRLAQMQERLGANAHKINVNRQGRGVQQLRSMMPEHFGAAFLIQRNQVTPQHYVFGLEDLPGRESLPKTRYGQYPVLQPVAQGRQSGAGDPSRAQDRAGGRRHEPNA